MNESAYDILDRYLRNNLVDDDYAEYSIALEELAFDAARYRFLASRNLMDNGKEPTPAQERRISLAEAVGVLEVIKLELIQEHQ